MGGNALKAYGVGRVSTDTLDDTKKYFSTLMCKHGIQHYFPESIGSKKDHGDLDIIVVSNERQACRDLFGSAVGFQSNGPVDSFAFQTPEALLQIDLIFMNPANIDYSYNYFCFNDLGNLVGRFAHKYGLKHGHDGLTMVLRDDTEVIGNITLTTDFKTAMDFLGFSHDTYLKGFDSHEQLYQYVSDHERFSPRMFDLNERNHTARVRDKKRPTYTGFLEWIDKNRGYLADYNWPLDKSVWLRTIFDTFPSAETEHARIWEEHNKRVQAKLRFNGEIVSELTGLTGKELGMLIRNFKALYPDWVEFVLEKTDKEVKEEVMNVFEWMESKKGEQN